MAQSEEPNNQAQDKSKEPIENKKAIDAQNIDAKPKEQVNNTSPVQINIKQPNNAAAPIQKPTNIKQPPPDPKKMVQPKFVNYEFNCKNSIYFEAPSHINFIYYSVIILIILIVAWAHMSKIEEVTHGEGKVIPSSRVKIIQSLDGGIISKIYIKDGELVKKDQVLIKLDDTRFGADYNQNNAQLISLIGEIARLKAEINNSSEIDFPKELDDYPEVKLGQTKLFQSIMSGFKHEKESLEKNLHLSEQELNLIMPLIKQGLMSQLERIRLEKSVTESKSKITDFTETFKTKVQTELTEKQNVKTALEEKLKGLNDRMKYTEITSPVEGYVNNFKLNTIGGVIKPGMDILEIVPLEEQLIIEAKVNPRDRAFIRQNQEATVKFPAYDSSIYGSLHAIVTSISADTSKDEKNNEFYLVRLTTEKSYLSDDPKNKIIPGMAASVSILTGKKSILFYLIRPVTKIKEFALKER